MQSWSTLTNSRTNRKCCCACPDDGVVISVSACLSALDCVLADSACLFLTLFFFRFAGTDKEREARRQDCCVLLGAWRQGCQHCHELLRRARQHPGESVLIDVIAFTVDCASRRFASKRFVSLLGSGKNNSTYQERAHKSLCLVKSSASCCCCCVSDGTSARTDFSSHRALMLSLP